MGGLLEWGVYGGGIVEGGMLMVWGYVEIFRHRYRIYVEYFRHLQRQFKG